MVKYPESGDPFISTLEEDLGVESDWEEGSPSVDNGTSKMADKSEELARAVLVTGSFSAYVQFPISVVLESDDVLHSWRSLFFYCCTNVISFAPLASNGVQSRSNYIRDNAAAAAPPPCSPKSVFILANLVRKPPDSKSQAHHRRSQLS